MKDKVQVGLIGSQFISCIHAESVHRCGDALLLAVASPTPGNAQKLADRFQIPRSFTDYRQMLAMPELDMVVIGVPNDAHCQVTLDCLAAAKHVVLEKPLCLNLAEADRVLAAARQAKRKLMYAEELCFAPK